MIMLVIVRGAKSLVLSAAILLLAAVPSRAAVIAYDNSATPLGFQAAEPREYGDEVRLAGGLSEIARVISGFEIEYAADYVGGATFPTMRFRIYLSDPANFFKPGQVLWESEVMPLFVPENNIGRLVFGDTGQPNQIPLAYNGQPVVIPPGYEQNGQFIRYDRITFTAEFTGLSMRTTEPRDFAGLVFYGNPTVGTSANDYWRRTPNGLDWQLARNNAVTRNNFGARFYVSNVPEPSVLALGSFWAAAGVWTLLRRRK